MGEKEYSYCHYYLDVDCTNHKDCPTNGECDTEDDNNQCKCKLGFIADYQNDEYVCIEITPATLDEAATTAGYLHLDTVDILPISM